jgi:hypothetical protein
MMKVIQNEPKRRGYEALLTGMIKGKKRDCEPEY